MANPMFHQHELELLTRIIDQEKFNVFCGNASEHPFSHDTAIKHIL